MRKSVVIVIPEPSYLAEGKRTKELDHIINMLRETGYHVTSDASYAPEPDIDLLDARSSSTARTMAVIISDPDVPAFVLTKKGFMSLMKLGDLEENCLFMDYHEFIAGFEAFKLTYANETFNKGKDVDDSLYFTKARWN